MVAYDSRRTPNPESLLRPETIEALRVALEAQRDAGTEPIAALARAIRAAAQEGRERRLPPEGLIIQLKALADDVGMPSVAAKPRHPRSVREWMITVCLRAYWNLEKSGSDAEE